MAFGGSAFLKTAQHFIANPSEDGSYLPPLLLLVLVFPGGIVGAIAKRFGRAPR